MLRRLTILVVLVTAPGLLLPSSFSTASLDAPAVAVRLDSSKTRIGLARAWKQLNSGARSGSESRFEEETLGFHEKVRAGYLERARLEPERFRIIDASGDEKQVQRDIREALTEFLGE